MKLGMIIPGRWSGLLAVMIVVAVHLGVPAHPAAAFGAQAQSESVIYTFPGGHGGATPYGRLVFDAKGILYGTTWQGGHYGYGSVFKLAPGAGGSWQQTIIYSFRGGKDSGFLFSGLTIDSEGNLYGTTTDDDGLYGYGTVFKLTLAADGSWTETVLYTFRGGEDGGLPNSLVLDPSGNLYGTTYEGGNLTACNQAFAGCGVVFELSPLSSGGWKESVLYAFQSGNDGALPDAGLVFDGEGNLYGTTLEGGGAPDCVDGCGTVFELSRTADRWAESVVHSFGPEADGQDSNATLVIDKAGNLYGTTHVGGIISSNCGPAGCGVAYEVSRNSAGVWAETVLHSFEGGSGDGSGPAEGGLTLDNAGNLYGTTAFGGILDAGTVFALSPATAGWKETLLHVFTSGSGGEYPFAAPVVDAVGDLYGTTADGGSANLGVAFKISRP